jgi:hypothetical protein
MKYDIIEELIGKTFTGVYATDSYLLTFKNASEEYYFEHSQDCCESVSIEDICGDLDDLVGVPLLVAEEATSDDSSAYECGMWTFYKFSTIKGSVTVRWYGESNGYYSVDVGLYKR